MRAVNPTHQHGEACDKLRGGTCNCDPIPLKSTERLRNRRNKIVGDHAEQVVIYHLSRFGLPTAHLETGWRVKRVRGRIVGAIPMRPVLADLVACLPNGHMVLIEVKREQSDRLKYSRLEEHQRIALDRWADAGALCLVAWVHPDRGVALIPWRGAPGWANHHALPWETAQALNWHPSQSLPSPKPEKRP